MSRVVLVVLVVLASCGAPAPAPVRAPAPSTPQLAAVRVASPHFAFLAGCWTRADGARSYRLCWEPAGDVWVGHYFDPRPRHIDRDLQLRIEPRGRSFVLRHFLGTHSLDDDRALLRLDIDRAVFVDFDVARVGAELVINGGALKRSAPLLRARSARAAADAPALIAAERARGLARIAGAAERTARAAHALAGDAALALAAAHQDAAAHALGPGRAAP